MTLTCYVGTFKPVDENNLFRRFKVSEVVAALEELQSLQMNTNQRQVSEDYLAMQTRSELDF